MRKKRDFVSFRFKKISLFFLFLFIVFGTVSIYAATSYRVNVSTTVGIDEFSQCRNCTNSGPADLFVPTGTSLEWNVSFANPPTGVSYACCSKYYAACNGTTGNAMWYNGCSIEESLKTTCSGYPTCQSSNVYTYSGCSGGSCTSTQSTDCQTGATCCGSACGGGTDVYTKSACGGSPGSAACGSPAFSATCGDENICSTGDVYLEGGCSGGVGSAACGVGAKQYECTDNFCSSGDIYDGADCTSGPTCGSGSVVDYCTDIICDTNDLVQENGCAGSLGSPYCTTTPYATCADDCQPGSPDYQCWCGICSGASCSTQYAGDYPDCGSCYSYCDSIFP